MSVPQEKRREEKRREAKRREEKRREEKRKREEKRRERREEGEIDSDDSPQFCFLCGGQCFNLRCNTK